MADSIPLNPEHVVEAARVARRTLEPAAGRDWSVKAGGLDWDCRRTLDHMVGAPLFHGTNLAMRSTQITRPPRLADMTTAVADLLPGVEISATFLMHIAQAAGPTARGFHPLGMADSQGFVAMSANELLVHTFDVCQGLGIDYRPPAELSSLVLRRLFPWVKDDGDPAAALLWATGRIELPGKGSQGDDWASHCAPLSEWDGTVKKRPAAPPAPPR